MPVLTKKVNDTREEVTGIVCDKCNTTVPKDDIIAFQECVFLDFIGGYGSVWGDGTHVSVALCQYCGHDLFKNIATIKE